MPALAPASHACALPLPPVQIMPLFEATYGGKAQGLRFFVYWRLFYLACSELFAYNGGAPGGLAGFPGCCVATKLPW